MPASPLINYKEAEQLLRRGVPRAVVAERYGVTPAAIGVAIMRGNIKVDYQKPQQRLPWKVRREHQRLNIPSMLRYALRIMDGELDRIPERMRKPALEFLMYLDKNDLVIKYDPDAEQPFQRVPRRDGLDLGLIYEPDPEADNDAASH